MIKNKHTRPIKSNHGRISKYIWHHYYYYYCSVALRTVKKSPYPDYYYYYYYYCYCYCYYYY